MSIEAKQAVTDTNNTTTELYSSVAQLAWRKFKAHRLARIGATVLAALYLIAIFSDFIAPYPVAYRHKGFRDTQPTKIHIKSEITGEYRRPFIYAYTRTKDPVSLRPLYNENKEKEYTIRFFCAGPETKFWGIFRMETRLFCVDENVPIFLFGTESVSRDVFSRSMVGSRISLFIGLGGVAISFVLGGIIGGISGYIGGLLDEGIQRTIDLLMGIPTLPIWIGLSAAVPDNWSVGKTYFAITIVLSVVGWTGLAREVRGKLLALREMDFVTAARVSGSSTYQIIVGHLLPNFSSHLIVSITLAIPAMILGETALSFIGLGMKDPGVSWGVLLQECLGFTPLIYAPWKLIPSIFVVITVLMFNFLGDGLRDATDPYSL